MIFINKLSRHTNQFLNISTVKNETFIEFNQVKNEEEFKKILDDILLYVCDNKTKKIILDLRKIRQFDKIVKSMNLYLKFIQFLPLFGISNIKFVLNSKYSINHLKNLSNYNTSNELSVSFS